MQSLAKAQRIAEKVRNGDKNSRIPETQDSQTLRDFGVGILPLCGSTVSS
jgi:hypothetical protein